MLKLNQVFNIISCLFLFELIRCDLIIEFILKIFLLVKHHGINFILFLRICFVVYRLLKQDFFLLLMRLLYTSLILDVSSTHKAFLIPLAGFYYDLFEFLNEESFAFLLCELDFLFTLFKILISSLVILVLILISKFKILFYLLHVIIVRIQDIS
jgi:hypothetical protein